MALGRVTRAVTATVAVVAAVVGAFTAGVLSTGAPATDGPAGEVAASRLDEAAGRIEGESLRPVDRQALDAAAITAMLLAADDQWGGWEPVTTGGPVTRPTSVRVERLAEPAGPVTVLTVTGFDRGTGRQVRTALAGLPTGTSGVVLDLRGNGGGLLDEAVETASAFLDGGTIVSAVRRDGSVQTFEAVSPGDVRTPLAVLVDGGSASAAEVVAGALLDRGRGVLVGSRTFGKGTVQEPTRLSDGSVLQLTVARYATPGGHDLEGVGLQPDIEVAPGSGPDVGLQRAVAVLPGLLASAGGS